ncbi:MAG: cohesin domain-containing protein [Candidatus Bathyarchaeia archaeon]
MKRSLIIFLATFFLVPMLMLTIPAAYSSGDDTTVSIVLDNISELYGIELKVSYSNLDLVTATPYPPWTFYLIVKNEIDESSEVYRFVAVALPPSPPYSGTTKIVELTFQSTVDAANLQIEAKLVDKLGNNMPFEIDGLTIRGLPVHDVAVKKVLACPRSAYQGDPITVEVNVENQGNFEETFDVTVYADQDGGIIGDEIIIGTQTVTLAPKTVGRLYLVWDTTGAPYGGYYISARLSIVSGETDVLDNFIEKADYVGGIYPRPYVRQAAEIQAQALLAGLLGLIFFAGALYVRNYWFNC